MERQLVDFEPRVVWSLPADCRGEIGPDGKITEPPGRVNRHIGHVFYRDGQGEDFSDGWNGNGMQIAKEAKADGLEISLLTGPEVVEGIDARASYELVPCGELDGAHNGLGHGFKIIDRAMPLDVDADLATSCSGDEDGVLGVAEIETEIAGIEGRSESRLGAVFSNELERLRRSSGEAAEDQA